MSRFLLPKAILALVAMWLLGFGIHLLLKPGADINRLAAFALVLLGVCILLAVLRSASEVFIGRILLEETVTLPLPGTAVCELTVPIPMSKGRVIIFFEDTTERYAGKVTLTKVPGDGAPAVSAILLRIKPSLSRVPKWSPTSDAGEVLEHWPRGTGAAADPVVLKFSFPIQSQEKLRLEFKLESNFRGTKLERRFPMVGEETVRVVVKA